jgi:hypothetical protein
MLEQKIAELTAAVVALTQTIQQAQVNLAAPAAAVQQAAQAVVPSAAAPNGFVPPAAAVPAPPDEAPQMPPAPSFMAPPAAPPIANVPFTDAKGLIAYAMDAYNSLGAAKAAGLQNILVSLGHQNINDVRADQYPAFYQAVEALKVA